MNRTNGMRFLIFAVTLSVGLAATATVEAAEPSFLPAMLSYLGNDGWSLQERNALAEAAGQLDWNGTQAANAEAVALALSLQRNERLQLSAMEQAQLALQLALMTKEMRAAGLDAHDDAVAAVGAVRNALGEIRAWMAGGRHGELGDIIRDRISAAVRSQVQLSAMAQSAGKGPDDRGGSGSAGGTGTGMQGSGSNPGLHGNGR